MSRYASAYFSHRIFAFARRRQFRKLATLHRVIHLFDGANFRNFAIFLSARTGRREGRQTLFHYRRLGSARQSSREESARARVTNCAPRHGQAEMRIKMSVCAVRDGSRKKIGSARKSSSVGWTPVQVGPAGKKCIIARARTRERLTPLRDSTTSIRVASTDLVRGNVSFYRGSHRPM